MSATLFKLTFSLLLLLWLLARLLPAHWRAGIHRHVRLVAWVVLAVFSLAALLRGWYGLS